MIKTLCCKQTFSVLLAFSISKNHIAKNRLLLKPDVLRNHHGKCAFSQVLLTASMKNSAPRLLQEEAGRDFPNSREKTNADKDLEYEVQSCEDSYVNSEVKNMRLTVFVYALRTLIGKMILKKFDQVFRKSNFIAKIFLVVGIVSDKHGGWNLQTNLGTRN